MLADEIKIDLEKTAKNIRKYMEKQELSRTDLGKITGLTRGCISNYTNAYNPPSLTNLGVLAEVLGVDISKIVVYKREGSVDDGAVGTEELKK